MTINETLAKAMEGGYPKEHLYASPHVTFLFLDPLFWQSLGKALGWSQGEIGVCRSCGARKDTDCYCREMPLPDIQEEWLYHWHRFIDHLADGGSSESFFATL